SRYSLFFYHVLARSSSFLFFFHDTATTDIYTLSLHDALPICLVKEEPDDDECGYLPEMDGSLLILDESNSYSDQPHTHPAAAMRSEEHTSELQSRFDLVCRLLLEKKNNNKRYK